MSDDIQPAPTPIPEVRDKRCPSCTEALAPDAVICIQCGFNLRTGTHLQTRHLEFQKTWDTGFTGLTMRYRAITAGVMCLGLNLIPCLFFRFDSLLNIILVHLVFILLAIGLTVAQGTCVQITLMRDSHGHFVLSRTFFFSFTPIRTEVDQLVEFRVAQTRYNEKTETYSILLTVILLPIGVFPALIYWRFFASHEMYTLSLIRHSDFSEVLIYNGNSRDKMIELADLFKTVGGITLGG